MIAGPGLTTAHRGLANRLDYQLKAVRQALDPDKLHPRILLADAVGLGKVMIIADLVGKAIAWATRGDTSGNSRPNSWS